MAGKLAASGGGSGKGRLEVTADPNVIPFIDVMLVLLIIFMIAAPISSVDIEVDMPTSRIDPSKRPPRPTWISLNASTGGSGVDVYRHERRSQHGHAWRADVRSREDQHSPHDCRRRIRDQGSAHLHSR